MNQCWHDRADNEAKNFIRSRILKPPSTSGFKIRQRIIFFIKWDQRKSQKLVGQPELKATRKAFNPATLERTSQSRIAWFIKCDMQKVQIKKKSGGFRTVYVQGPRDKNKYTALANYLVEKIKELEVPGVIHGFMPGRSPVTNAMAHVGKKFVLQCDLADFFNHCSSRIIREGLLHYVPENWQSFEMREAARVLSDRCVIDDAAQQGLSSSPAAANIAAIPMDRTIVAALTTGLTYTRYADDLTISGNEIAPLLALRDKLPEIAKRHGQEINEKKTRIQAAHFGRIVITGVAIDENGIYPTRRSRRKARAAKHRAEIKGGWYNKAIANGCEEWNKLLLPKTEPE